MTARDIAILDLLHHGYRPRAPDHPDHERLMIEWATRYRVRLASAERMLAAGATIEAEERSCTQSP